MRIIICEICGENKKHHAHNLCKRCYLKKRRAEHSELFKKYRRNQYEKNCEQEKAYQRQYHFLNSEYRKRYRKKNSNKIKEQKQKYYQKNREKRIKYNYGWNKTLSGLVCFKKAAIKRKTGIIVSDIKRVILDNFLKYAGQNHCEKCGKSLAIEFHIDHIIPISKNGKSNYNNLQILCANCNSIKGTTIADYRYIARLNA